MDVNNFRTHRRPTSNDSATPNQGRTELLGYQPVEDVGLLPVKTAGAKSSMHLKRQRSSPVFRGVLYVSVGACLFFVGIGLSYMNIHLGRSSGHATNKQVTPQSGQSQNEQKSGLLVQSSATNAGLGQIEPMTSDGAPSVGNGYTQEAGTLDGSGLKMIRQPLPEAYKQNPQETLKQFATQQMKADQTIPSQKWGTGYLVTDRAHNVQVVLLANQLQLVVIQSEALHSIDSWARYVDTL